MDEQQNAATQAAEQQGYETMAKAVESQYGGLKNAEPSEGFPVEVTEQPDAISVAEAVDLLKRCHATGLPDLLAQQVHGFVLAHGG